MKTTEIKVKSRFRKDNGQLDGLMASIKEFGQLQPVLIDKENNLISGFRRLESCRRLEIDIDVRVVDFDNPKRIEFEDNIHNKLYTEREIFEISQHFTKTQSRKPGPKANNSVTNDNAIKPIEKVAEFVNKSVPHISKINKIYKSGYEGVKEKLDNGDASVNKAYSEVLKLDKLTAGLEGEAKGMSKAEVEPIPYGDGIHYIPEPYKGTKMYTSIINDGDEFPTLTSQNTWFHENLKEFSLREYASVQDFPDSFNFVGSNGAIRQQIGNAVSQKMAAYISQHLKGKTCGDLFSGCGGFSLGVESNDIKTIWAVEWDVNAAKSFKMNFPDTEMLHENIVELNPDKLANVDIIIGGPPCQGFSLAGLGLIDDPRNQLYKEFIRIIKAKMPVEFIMENVPKILTTKNKKTCNANSNSEDIKTQIIHDFEDIGYDVEVKEVFGPDIGMRQKRKRAFFIGTLRPDADSQEMAIAA